MNVRQRGLVTFAVMLVLGIIGCIWLPFIVMPGAGVAIALPIIEVPGEVLIPGFLAGVDLTNTIVGTLLADVLIIIFVLLAWRASRGWTKEVPGRFQSWVEWFIGDIFHNFMKGVGGEKLHKAPLLWPLVATIFLLLLTGNWLKLLPGVETVGIMHCAHEGQSGYPMRQGITDTSYTLYVDAPLDSGTRQTLESEHACEHFFAENEFNRYPVETPEQILAQIEAAEVALNDAEIELNNLTAATAEAESLTAEQVAELEHAFEAVEKAERALERQQIRLESAEAIPELERRLEDLGAQLAALSAESAAGHGEEGEAAAVPAFMAETGPTEAQIAAERAALEAEIAQTEAELQYARTQLHYPTATLTLSNEALEAGAAPFIFHVTPYVRGMSTDLSLTFMLAILAIVAVQIYGVWALGPAYFEKFINISALGNLGKKPMGAIDFIVGLIEIISEIGKIVSLAFRLFGNLFAGGVALIALTFLVALFIPMVMYGLEIIIGTVQALVFAVLTLVFAVQAMEAHHGDEEHAEHAEEH
jgi:F0F1-type ATP synthase membrane subunit a